ncbi:MAG: ATP-grasp domain-containing protein [Bacteroidales bacterium]|nr:ATP-grasp domain-containing protein [Bacteroidales bacterium]
MKIAIIYNKDIEGVINTFGMQNKEFYNEKTVKKVAASLEKAGHNVAVMDGNKQIIERLENFLPRVTEGENMGMIFNMAYGIQGESRYTHIPSMLEMLGLPYVGSSPSGHAIALDKVLTKIIWKNNNLPTPDFWVFNSAGDDLSTVNYPVIVKPKMESVSFGLRVVNNPADLRDAVEFIVNEFDQQALVEQFIRGREFAIGLLGNSPIESFPVLEIDLDGDPDAIQTVDHKKLNPRQKICPAQISENLAAEMQRLSIEAFKAINLRDFARVDIRLDENDNIYLLEINSMASLGESGSYPHAAKVAGYSYEALVNRMLDVAAVRYFSGNMEPPVLPGDLKAAALPQTARIRSFLKTREPQAERLLRKLVDVNTHVRNVEGVNRSGEIITSELSQLGFRHEVFPQVEVGNILFYTNSSDQECDYLILLPVDNRVKLPNHENFHRDEQYIEGTGIWENKGGISVVISALQALRFIRKLRKLRIGILLTTDSSIDGKFSKSIIQQKSEQANVILAVSGSTKDGGIVLSRSGSARYWLETKLMKKEFAENISITAANFNRMIAGITDITRDDNENLIAPFEINFSSNIFKEIAYGSAGISVRYNSTEAMEQIEGKIKKIINQYKRNKVYHIHFEGGLKRPAMYRSEVSDNLYNKILSIAKSIDVRVAKIHRWSSADICHINREMPKIDGLGPIGEFLPSNNERILRHSLVDRALMFALILLRNK